MSDDVWNEACKEVSPCNDQDGHTFGELILGAGKHTCTCGELTMTITETAEWVESTQPVTGRKA